MSDCKEYLELFGLEEIKHYADCLEDKEFYEFPVPIHTDFVYWTSVIGDSMCIAKDDTMDFDLCYVFAIMKSSASSEAVKLFSKMLENNDTYVLHGAGSKDARV